jgi:DNA replication protein DnaC
MCDCLRRRIEERNLGELRSYSNLEALQHLTFETFDPGVPGVVDAYQAAREFVRDTRRWLVFYGGFGAGKTHLAAAIAHELIKRKSRVVFQVVPDLLDHLRASFGPNSEVRYDQLFEAVKVAEVVILDDLGEERPNSFAEEKLFQLINHRYNRRLPTVVTTNRDPERIDQRIWSRLNDQSLVTTVHVGAGDYRLRPVRERRTPRPVKPGPTPRR